MVVSAELEQAFRNAFPFDPYDIQLAFMSNMYNCIEERQFGLFESPTGTGKTLSIICALLTWLKEHRRQLNAKVSGEHKQNDGNENEKANDGACSGPAWLFEAAEDGPVQDSRGNSNGSTPSGSNASLTSTSCGPRVIYAARTHSQLSQFMGASIFHVWSTPVRKSGWPVLAITPSPSPWRACPAMVPAQAFQHVCKYCYPFDLLVAPWSATIITVAHVNAVLPFFAFCTNQRLETLSTTSSNF